MCPMMILKKSETMIFLFEGGMNHEYRHYRVYPLWAQKIAVSRHELQRRTGLPDRTVRALIEDARRKERTFYHPVRIKVTGKRNNVGEIKEFLRESDGRIRKTAQTVEALRRYVAEQEGEDVVPVRAHFRHLQKPKMPKEQITF